MTISNHRLQNKQHQKMSEKNKQIIKYQITGFKKQTKSQLCLYMYILYIVYNINKYSIGFLRKPQNTGYHGLPQDQRSWQRSLRSSGRWRKHLGRTAAVTCSKENKANTKQRYILIDNNVYCWYIVVNNLRNNNTRIYDIWFSYVFHLNLRILWMFATWSDPNHAKKSMPKNCSQLHYPPRHVLAKQGNQRISSSHGFQHSFICEGYNNICSHILYSN